MDESSNRDFTISKMITKGNIERVLFNLRKKISTQDQYKCRKTLLYSHNSANRKLHQFNGKVA